MNKDMINNNYVIQSCIYRGENSRVYRAKDAVSKVECILKCPPTEFPSVAQIALLKSEYRILDQIVSDFVIKPLKMEILGQQFALVFKDEKFVSLLEKKPQQSLNMIELIKIALKIVEGIIDIHKQRLIHCDINPHNILMSKDCKNVKIIDFGLCRSILGAKEQLYEERAYEGTPDFLAPEQTGKRPWPLDQRTDLYSFGLTLHWLLTGKRPFDSKDIEELLQMQLLAQPRLAHEQNPDIPQHISQIIQKLTSKNPDGRYQSAEDLRHDLILCLEALETGKLPQGLVSLDLKTPRNSPKETAWLAREDKFQLCKEHLTLDHKVSHILITGSVGSGKSTLLKALQFESSYLSGFGSFNCEAMDPLQGLWDAIRMVTRKFLMRSKEEVSHWSETLIATLDPQAIDILCRTIPELGPIFSASFALDQNNTVDNSAQTARNLLQKAVMSLMSSFAPYHLQLEIYLDNLERMDPLALEICRMILKLPFVKMIGTFGLDSEHSKLVSPQDLLHLHQKTLHIQLEDLTYEQSKILLTKILVCEAEEVSPEIFHEVFKMTSGNPGKITYVIEELLKLQMVVRSEDDKNWHLSGPIHGALFKDTLSQGSSHELLKALSPEGIELVKIASHLGPHFCLSDLLGLVIMSPTDLKVTLIDSIEKRAIYAKQKDFLLICSIDDETDLSHAEFANITLYFCSNFIPSNITKHIDLTESMAISYSIGRKKLWEFRHSKLSSSTEHSRLLEIVKHLNKGAGRICEASEFFELADLNYRAGQSAFRTGSFSLATDLFKSGILLLPTGWEEARELILNLNLSLLEASIASSRKEETKLARETLEEHELTSLERARFYTILTRSFAARREFHEALNLGIKGLKSLSINLHPHPHLGHVLGELLKTKRLAPLKTLTKGMSEKEKVDPNLLAAQELLMTLTAPAYFSNQNLFTLIVLKMTQLTAQYGLSPIAPYALSVYGVLLTAALGDIEGGHKIGQIALDLLDTEKGSRLNIPQDIKAKTLVVYHSSISHWKNPLKNSPEGFKKAHQLATLSGDFEYAAISAVGFCAYSFLHGMNLSQVDKNFCDYDLALTSLGEASHAPLLKVIGQCVKDLLAETEGSIPSQVMWTRADTEQLLLSADKTTTCAYHVFSLLKDYILGRDTEALMHAKKATAFRESILGTAYQPLYVFYKALILIKDAYNKPPLLRGKDLAKITLLVNKFRTFSSHCPQNYQAKSIILQTELDFLIFGDIQSIKKLENAATIAINQELWQDAALAFELAADHLLAKGLKRLHRTYIYACLELYLKWGALAKVSQLKKQYEETIDFSLDLNLGYQTQHSLNDTHHPSSYHLSRGLIPHYIGRPSARRDSFDITTLAHFSKMLFKTSTEEQVFENLLKIMVAHVGAEQGMVVFLHSESQVPKKDSKSEFYIAAEYQGDLKPKIYFPWKLLSADKAPISLFRYALNIDQTIVLRDAANDELFRSDPYIISKELSSCLCVPLSIHNISKCILYLEINIKGAEFSETEVNFVTTLAAMLATSLDHLKIKQELESRVDARTKDLSEAMKELSNAQERIVEVRKQSALSRMVNGIAHEMNTPLGVAVTMLSTFTHHSKNLKTKFTQGLTRTELSEYIEFTEKSLDILSHNIKIISGLVEQFKDSSIENKNEQPMPVQLYRLVNTAIESYKLQYPNCAIRFSVHIDEPIEFESYPATLTQILYNLIKNADTHGFNKGAGTIQIGAKNEADHITLTFSDDGVGVPQESLAKIFDPFFSTSRQKDNMGLGLHIVHQLVHQKLHGSITIDGSREKGLTFLIKIPHQVLTLGRAA